MITVLMKIMALIFVKGLPPQGTPEIKSSECEQLFLSFTTEEKKCFSPLHAFVTLDWFPYCNVVTKN